MDFGSSNCIPILIGGNKQGYLVGMIVKIPKRLVYAELAQPGEHLPYKQRVTGSSPVGPTYIYFIFIRRCGSIPDKGQDDHCRQSG